MWLRCCESRSYYVEASVSFAAATAITRYRLRVGRKNGAALEEALVDTHRRASASPLQFRMRSGGTLQLLKIRRRVLHPHKKEPQGPALKFPASTHAREGSSAEIPSNLPTEHSLDPWATSAWKP